MVDNNPVHGMIDIETLGIRPGSVITQIGICIFTRAGILDSTNIGVDHNFQKDRNIDKETMLWWDQQSHSPFLKDMLVPFTALAKMSAFVQTHHTKYFWANGTHFDISQLESLCASHAFEPPWKYNKVMDMRTIMKLAGATRNYPKNNHNAEDDAVNQAQRVIQLFQEYDFTF